MVWGLLLHGLILRQQGLKTCTKTWILTKKWAEKNAFPLREDLFCFSKQLKGDIKAHRWEDEGRVSDRGWGTVPSGSAPISSHPSTHRVLAANTPFRSAVYFSDLDPCQAREFLSREFLPSRSQILTMTTPRKRKRTACWNPGSRSFTYTLLPRQALFLLFGTNNCLEICKIPNSPTGCTLTLPPPPIPNEEPKSWSKIDFQTTWQKQASLKTSWDSETIPMPWSTALTGLWKQQEQRNREESRCHTISKKVTWMPKTF